MAWIIRMEFLTIWHTRAHSGVDELFLSTTSQKHNVSVVGSSENTNYLLSFGYWIIPEH